MTQRKILIAVTGMSPQIVTETLYALYQQNWLPEEIHLLTTSTGRTHIINTLLGEQGYFTRLCHEYHLPAIRFDESTIHVINENGIELDDIRTPQQNEAAANTIVRHIHDWCNQADTELHVSIAGGRKSMGFYIAYALSLFGRVQDSLSHVLVEQDFETEREFFYPPQKETWINTKNGMRNAAQAQIMLAEIPFVRMAEGKPKLELNDDWTFSQAVSLAQNIVNDTKLTIDLANRQLICGAAQPITLSPIQFAVYLTVAQFHQENQAIAINQNNTLLSELIDRFMHNYRLHNSDMQGNSTTAKQYYQAYKNKMEHEIFRVFQENRSHIAKKLKTELGSIGSRYKIIRIGANNDISYSLELDKNLITIQP